MLQSTALLSLLSDGNDGEVRNGEVPVERYVLSKRRRGGVVRKLCENTSLCKLMIQSFSGACRAQHVPHETSCMTCRPAGRCSVGTKRIRVWNCTKMKYKLLKYDLCTGGYCRWVSYVPSTTGWLDSDCFYASYGEGNVSGAWQEALTWHIRQDDYNGYVVAFKKCVRDCRIVIRK